MRQGVLRARVRVDDVRVGEVTGVVADASFGRVIGLEVTGPGARRWFLPWIAVRVVGGAVTTESVLGLIEVGELDGYTRLGAQVVNDPADLGALTVSSDGRVGREDESVGVSLDAAAGTPM